MRTAFVLAASLLASACSTTSDQLSIADAAETTGSIELINPQAKQFIAADAKISIRGKGYRWTEGPVWIEQHGFLLFSDIPNNTIVKYQPNKGTELYLENSGATGLEEGDYGQGSNGLLLNPQGQLVLLQQGDRRVALMDAPLNEPQSKFVTLAGEYQGKRLNSPNDAVYHNDGSLYFTDPPYGLNSGMNDSRKELDFQGIYRLSQDGELELLDNSVNFPNGIALTLDQKTLIVAVSDDKHPRWLAYDVNPDGSISNKRIFHNAKALLGVAGEQGLPDGMAVHSSGNIFATGPGGVWLFSPQGEVLAKIRTGRLTANCTLSADEKYLFITAHDTLMSVPLL
ncbi:SMP-30/gluconolactonase/LRE family protein [Agarivorans albus]|uniref:Gluconolactonase n=1 Tax=Agarivorans albus MKT 106 TaxID=1331007 RepID=R9PS45_AGAAL|nr:SMP-30/gluconolactonase/LRE family protein [Agarivorans albus]GAD04125.1 gluconolactonase [Agarivorans albus MKT 106]